MEARRPPNALSGVAGAVVRVGSIAALGAGRAARSVAEQDPAQVVVGVGAETEKAVGARGGHPAREVTLEGAGVDRGRKPPLRKASPIWWRASRSPSTNSCRCQGRDMKYGAVSPVAPKLPNPSNDSSATNRYTNSLIDIS